MFGFKLFTEQSDLFLAEEKKKARGIQHLPHAFEPAFHARRGAIGSAISNIQGVMSGRTPISRKIDDRMSFQIMRDAKGRIAVKYKGAGAQYNYSEEDIKKQYSEKPYIAGPLINIFRHGHKVLPKGAGEYQGGYLSSREDRTEEDGHIGHKPNTIHYSVPKNSAEGRKLARAPLSIALHSRINEDGSTTPIGEGELQEHPDVHVMSHLVSAEERKMSPAARRKALEHLAAAKALNKGHGHEHHEGHEETLQRYLNSTIDTGEKPSAKGYKRFLEKHHQKRIDAVKTEKAKNQKRAEMQAAINHVNDNLEKFDRSFDIHHNLQKATYAVADSLSKTAHGGYRHHIDGQEAAGEGFVAGGSKYVPRAFTEANRKRSAILKAQKSVI
jgi:hypothetical protein